MCGNGWHASFMGFPAGNMFFLLLIALLIAIVWKLYTTNRISKSIQNVSADKSSSLQILENRLAKGEISIEEFEKLKHVLQG